MCGGVEDGDGAQVSEKRLLFIFASFIHTYVKSSIKSSPPHLLYRHTPEYETSPDSGKYYVTYLLVQAETANPLSSKQHNRAERTTKKEAINARNKCNHPPTAMWREEKRRVMVSQYDVLVLLLVVLQSVMIVLCSTVKWWYLCIVLIVSWQVRYRFSCTNSTRHSTSLHETSRLCTTVVVYTYDVKGKGNPGAGTWYWNLVIPYHTSTSTSTRYQEKSGMWITADFRLYPPVFTANQELVSPTGDHRYRGGTERAHPRGFRV